MSIQKLEFSKSVEGSADIKRGIDKASLGIILDTTMITQYSQPEQSTVRELTANAVDAQNEKEIAIKIKKGENAKDYYIDRSGEMYEASKYNDAYYDLKWLDTKNNHVQLTYNEKGGGGYSDTFTIQDFGVGIGGDRLQGYFEIGFSTKRNTIHALGAFGFGNKASLSLHNNYYLMDTRHNGCAFSFTCYARKIESNIGPFNKDGSKNKYVTFDNEDDPDNPIKIYYRDTTEKNGTTITVPLKRTHRSKFENAVKDQLLYFDNVKFTINREYGSTDHVNFKALIQYNSETLLLSDTRRFSEPHIVIVKDKESPIGVCYGNVNFDELEMQRIRGPVGFKCPIRSVIRNEDGTEEVLQEGVSVTPSREQVIWDEHTRDYVKMIIDSASDEASKLVDKELKGTDVIDWYEKISSVLSRSSHNSTLGKLSTMVDTTKLNPKFNNTKWDRRKIDSCLNHFTTTRINCRKTDDDSREISLNTIEPNLSTAINTFVVNNTDRITDQTNFAIVLRNEKSNGTYYNVTIANLLRVKSISEIKKEIKPYYKNLNAIDLNKKAVAKHQECLELLVLIEKSKHSKKYSDIVPTDKEITKFKANGIIVQDKTLTNKDRRKKEERLLFKVASTRRSWGGENSSFTHYNFKFEDIKKAVKNGKLDIYYGNNRDNDARELCVSASKINYSLGMNKTAIELHDMEYGQIRFTRGQMFTIISKESKKYLEKNGVEIKPINDYFFELVDDKEGQRIVVSKDVRDWYTADKVRGIMDLNELKAFKEIDKEKYKDYSELLNFASNTLKGTHAKLSFPKALRDQLDNIGEFAQFITEETDEKAISDKAKALFGNDKIIDAELAHLEKLEKFRILKEYHSNLGFIKYLSFITRNEKDKIKEFADDIKFYIDYKMGNKSPKTSIEEKSK